MISQKEVNVKDNSKVFLKITVPEDEVRREYDALIKDYCGKAVIKGFRRGKVPAEVLLRKYGDEIKSETAYTVIRKSLEEAFEQIEEKPLAYAQPEVTEKKEIELGKDFTFEVSYDTYPKIDLGAYKGVKAEKLIAEIGEEDMRRELEALQEKNSIVKEKKDGTVERSTIVTVDYAELNEAGNPVPAGAHEGFVCEVGKNTSMYQFDEDLLGLKAGEEKTLTKTYTPEYDVPELAGKTVTLKVTVKTVKEKIIPKLDDELAQDLSDKYKTLDDLKKDIGKKLNEAGEEKIRDALAMQIVEKIAADSAIPLPGSMVAVELERSWDELCQRFNKREDIVLRALKNDGKTKEGLFNDWRPGAEKKLRAELVLNAVEEKENITAADSDLEAEIKKYADERGLEYDKAKEAYEKMNLLDYLKRSIVRQKTIGFLIENADVKKGKKVKFLDLLQGNY